MNRWYSVSMKKPSLAAAFFFIFVGCLTPFFAGAATSETPAGSAYVHVTPADVGVTIGVGVVGPVPSTQYTGSMVISSPTTIENQLIDGCLRIESDNVTIRNSVIDCGGLYPIQIKNGSRDFVLEYSQVMCGSNSKIFYYQSGAPDSTVRYNEASGCDDFFFINGDVSGAEIAYNYLHTTNAGPSSHSDGFQIGEAGNTYGDIHIHGNYFHPNNPDGGETGLMFSTNYSQIDLLLENNRIFPWGYYTLRSNGNEAKMVARNNVLSLEEETEGKPIASGSNWTLTCNRYEDGSFPGAVMGGNDTSNCEPFSGESGDLIQPADAPEPNDEALRRTLALRVIELLQQIVSLQLLLLEQR